ncbi:LSD1 zinc finger domain containing protein [Musa troglodytarum]|uniref:LSD1 zinc finger domain containing protein n=1 Tax=Musa troglodytarum TaxID=320322 RepID=A0A9E7I5W2_9LILI|nr:LSD1 zinc finger domain containing protein [Musa troglodytarum]
MEMAQLMCRGCRTLLMYSCGATSVRCSCCNTINITGAANQVAYVNCGQCRTRLMYPYGAPSVKCSICQSITNVGMPNTRVPVPAAHRPNEIAPVLPSTSVVCSNSKVFFRLTNLFMLTCMPFLFSFGLCSTLLDHQT